MDDLALLFVDPLPEELRCPFHQGVLQDPVVAKCGHSFCRTCLHADEPRPEEEEVLEQECPICTAMLSGPFFPNHVLVAVIGHLKVHCPSYLASSRSGCRVVVPLGELSLHLETCTFSDHSLTPHSPCHPYQGKND